MRCYNCGEEMDKDEKICAYCGFQTKYMPSDEISEAKIAPRRKTENSNKLYIFNIREYFKNADQYTKTVSIALLLTFAALIFTVLFPFLSDMISSENMNWDSIILSEALPHPEFSCEILNNTQKELELTLYDTSIEDYQSYINSCREFGYVIDERAENGDFKAYNADGFKLGLSYENELSKVNVLLSAPLDKEKIEWELSSNASLLPIPKSFSGVVLADTLDRFTLKICDTPPDSYKEYIKECIGFGYNIDSRNTNERFVARSASGYELSLSYEGNNIMGVDLIKLSDEAFEDSQKLPISTEHESETVFSEKATQATEAPKVEQNNNTESDGVYITPTGKRYHLSKKCAGKNAQAVTLEKAQEGRTPCKKCAQ